MDSKECTQVEYLHCLTHPGFGAYINQGVKPEHEMLFERYAEMARAMTARDAMIAMLYRPVAQNANYETFVHDRIVRMKEELGQRMLIISLGTRLFYPDQLGADIVRARDVFHHRGLSIAQSTHCIAYGETYKSCVPTFASAIVTAYQLSTPATMPAHYTNIGVRPGETLDGQVERFAAIEEQRFLPNVVVDWAVPEA